MIKKGEKINRRKFLALASKAPAVIALPWILPSGILGTKGAVPPSDRIVMGCIGLGGQGIHNMRAFIQQPEVEMVALCDVDSGTPTYGLSNTDTYGLSTARQKAVETYRDKNRDMDPGSISLYRDYRELLAREDIDAVTVCTPDHWHGLISIAAAGAGKDIYCEKPLVNNIFEGRALCSEVAKNGRILQTGSHERSNDSVRFACELARNGRIGKLEKILVNMPNNDSHHKPLLENLNPQWQGSVPGGLDYDFWLGPASWRPYSPYLCHFWWRFNLDFGGGEMTDRGAHILDLAQLASDADSTGPVLLKAKGERPQAGLYNTFMEYAFEYEYGNGIRVIGTSEGERGLKLVGSEGWIFIHIHGGRLEAEPESLLREKIRPNEIQLGRSPGHHRNFLDSVKSRLQPVAHCEIGHRTATLCHLLNLAMLTDKEIKWDPEKETILNEPELNQMLRPVMRSPWHL